MSAAGWGLLAAAVIVAMGVWLVWGITVKAQRPKILPNDQRPPVPYEDVQWRSGAATIRGWLLNPPAGGSEPAPVIVVAHGWGSNRSRILRYAVPLSEAGFCVLTYDVRSHGESETARALTGLTFRDDLLAAVEWIRTRGDLDANRIGVLGHSVGGFGAVLALDTGADIAALVTDAMPVRFETMVEAELRRKGMPTFPLTGLIGGTMLLRSGISRRFLKHAEPGRILADNERSGRVPVLLVHSRKDSFIPPSELEHVLSKVPNVRHLFVDQEGHSVSERDPAFWREVLPFFEQHLKKRRPAASAASQGEIYK
ncbi:alpha/beta hydrolase [Cohnella thermotolerans]|uniref:alpha/beta hydrolase n=1 Tax=Cohnella thermotolerans TaxID=329858 RepID=UPI00040B1C3C|nr:alpha/beta fold hydrolase [Cohnella thermotolerans]